MAKRHIHWIPGTEHLLCCYRWARKLRRRVGVLAAASGLIVALMGSLATASATAFTANGTILCSPGPLVGVWVSAGNQSGWASYNRGGSYSKNIGWNVTYHLTVGCGGTPTHWATGNYDGQNLWEGWSWTVACGGGSCYGFDAEAA